MSVVRSSKVGAGPSRWTFVLGELETIHWRVCWGMGAILEVGRGRNWVSRVFCQTDVKGEVWEFVREMTPRGPGYLSMGKKEGSRVGGYKGTKE